MKRLGFSSLFITNKNGVLCGIVTIDSISALIREGKGDLRSVVDSNIQTVSPDATIHEIIPLSLNSPYPVAVIDSNKKLNGIIVRSSVLAGIAGETEE